VPDPPPRPEGTKRYVPGAIDEIRGIGQRSIRLMRRSIQRVNRHRLGDLILSRLHAYTPLPGAGSSVMT
jgi:hypothetical protein